MFKLRYRLFAAALVVGSAITIGATSTEVGACIDVIQPAINPVTGECREFPTPCQVPRGWVKVRSCPAV